MDVMDVQSCKPAGMVMPARARASGHVVYNHQATGLLCWHCAVLIATIAPLCRSTQSIMGRLMLRFITMHRTTLLVPPSPVELPRQVLAALVRAPPGNRPRLCRQPYCLIPALSEPIGGTSIVTPVLLRWSSWVRSLWLSIPSQFLPRQASLLSMEPLHHPRQDEPSRRRQNIFYPP